MAITHSSRLRNSAGKKYYISLDDTFGNSSYSVYTFSDNTDFNNKTGTLMYTESLRLMKKGATDNLINDNATSRILRKKHIIALFLKSPYYYFKISRMHK